MMRSRPQRGAPFICDTRRRHGEVNSKGSAGYHRCMRVLARVNANLERIDSWTRAVGEFFGADLFRLDVMTGERTA